jgi:hypothetical protein
MVRVFVIATIGLISASAAQANEAWNCLWKLESGRQAQIHITIEAQRLTIKGNHEFTIFEDNGEHLLAVHRFKVKDDLFSTWLLLERASGILTQFDDDVKVATKGVWLEGAPSKENMECTKE